MERRGRVQKGEPVGWGLWDVVKRAGDSQVSCDAGRVTPGGRSRLRVVFRLSGPLHHHRGEESCKSPWPYPLRSADSLVLWVAAEPCP